MISTPTSTTFTATHIAQLLVPQIHLFLLIGKNLPTNLPILILLDNTQLSLKLMSQILTAHRRQQDPRFLQFLLLFLVLLFGQHIDYLFEHGIDI